MLALAILTFAAVSLFPNYANADQLQCEVSTMTGKAWQTDYRIPSDTLPEHYDLYLHPNLQTNRFSGRVSIRINATQPRDFFVTHIKYMNVTETVLKDSDGNLVAIAEPCEFAPNEFWVITPVFPVPQGIYTLELQFDGYLDNGILGFYKSVYTTPEGVERALATSKFQPTYARRAFPCMDEPSFKSTFKITLVRPSGDGYISLSNMPIESTVENSPSPGLTEVTFNVSVPMVTYLAIFVVCDFAYIEKPTPEHNIPFRVYGTAHQVTALEYALDIGASVTDFYQNFFDVKYPLPKLDMAAIPDYSSGATEHWGLITYRETNLIFDNATSSSSNQMSVSEVISHELAHMWFGNLVTLTWWNDLWLNEGFATYIQYKGVKSYQTDWEMESRFLTSDLHGVLDLDATLGSHPIVVNVDTPDQINSVFDTISYSKGSSVIRMLESFMGSDDFKLGIHNFLVKYSFKNAITQNMFDELTAVSSDGLNITKIMDTWTRQKGYPVLTLTKTGGSYTITQQRFLTDPNAYNQTDEVSPFNYKWEVPVTFVSSVSQNPTQVWFHLEDNSISIPIPDGATWVKFNVEQLGYYRVNYPAEDWQSLTEVLMSDKDVLTVSDRTSLINDAFSLAAAGRIEYTLPLTITTYLSSERSIAPWETAIAQLNYFMDVFYYADAMPNLARYIQKLVSEIYGDLGWEDSGTFSTRLLRPMILRIACAVGMSDCMTEAGDRFLAWKATGTPIVPNLRTAVYDFGMKREGDLESWTWMFDKYKNESNAQERSKLLHGLSSVSDPAILYRLITLANDTTIVRQGDYLNLLGYISENRVGEPIVWDYVRDNWQKLVDRFTLNDRYLGNLIPKITSRFATPRRLSEMEAFFAENPEAGAGESGRKIALETVANNIRFVENFHDIINGWLIDNV